MVSSPHKKRAQTPSETFLGENVAWGKKYPHLSLEERALIQTQLSMQFKPAQIVRELDHSVSTVFFIPSPPVEQTGTCYLQSPDAKYHHFD
jgi:hypothetical protein